VNAIMSGYLLSVSVGLAVGAAYGLLGGRSPAPPIIALLGLLGMLLGEQLAQVASFVRQGQPIRPEAQHDGCAAHVFGSRPGGRAMQHDGERPPA
jgi:XapX domain-containing protein